MSTLGPQSPGPRSHIGGELWEEPIRPRHRFNPWRALGLLLCLASAMTVGAAALAIFI